MTCAPIDQPDGLCGGPANELARVSRGNIFQIGHAAEIAPSADCAYRTAAQRLTGLIVVRQIEQYRDGIVDASLCAQRPGHVQANPG